MSCRGRSHTTEQLEQRPSSSTELRVVLRANSLHSSLQAGPPRLSIQSSSYAAFSPRANRAGQLRLVRLICIRRRQHWGMLKLAKTVPCQKQSQQIAVELHRPVKGLARKRP